MKIQSKRKRRYSPAFSCLLLLLGLAAVKPVHAEGWTGEYYRLLSSNRFPELSREVSYLICREDCTPEEILTRNTPEDWQPLKKDVFYLNYSRDYIWLHLILDIPVEEAESWRLSVNWPYLDHISLYIRDLRQNRWLSRETIKDWQPPEESPSPYPFSFAVSTTTSPLEIFLKVHAPGKIQLPLSLLDEKTFSRKILVQSKMLGFFFGILAIMFIYNIILGIFTSDKSYFYYSLYVFSILLYTLGMTGSGPAYIWKGNTWINSHNYGMFSSFSFLMATVFIRNFLNLKKTGGWLLHLSTIVVAFWIGVIVLYLTETYDWLLILEDIGAFASGIIGLLTSCLLWKRGNPSAMYLTIAWTPLIFSTFFLMLGLTGIIPYTSRIRNIQNIGFVIEVILLSLALAERINRQRKEKEKAQKLSLKYYQQANDAKIREMIAKEDALAAEKAAKSQLSRKVEEKTKELRETLQELEKANSELALLSRTDGLTQLANRRYFDEVYEKEFKHAMRQKQPLSIILADVDHFKKLNDTFGHQAGDECLKLIARTFSSHISRREDLSARYGGEEFIAILPGTGKDDAAGIAEKIREAVRQLTVLYKGDEILMTMSLGICGRIPAQGADPDDLLKAADNALYRAKSLGRNRVENDS